MSTRDSVNNITANIHLYHLFVIIVFAVSLISLFLVSSSLFGESVQDSSAKTFGVFAAVSALLLTLILLIMLVPKLSTNYHHEASRLTAAIVVLVSTFTVNLWILLANNTIYWFDDSFYYAEIAYNIFHHGSSTFDRIALTNGYHPLWMGLLLLLTPLASALDSQNPFMLIRLVQLLQLFLLAALVFVIYLHLSRVLNSIGAILFSIAYLAFPYTRENTLNGMETTLLLLLLLGSNYLLTIENLTRNSKVLLVLSLGLITLTRIEAGLLWAGFCFLYLLFSRKQTLTVRDYSFLAWVAIGTVVGAAISFALNYSLVGRPISFAGEIKRQWASEQFMEFLRFTLPQKMYSLLHAAVAQTVIEFPAYIAIRPLAKLGYPTGSTAHIFAWTILVLLTLAILLYLISTRWESHKLLAVKSRLALFIVYAITLTAIYKVLLFSHTSIIMGGLDFQLPTYNQLFNTFIYLSIISWFVIAYPDLFRGTPGVVAILLLGVCLLGSQVISAYSETNRSLHGNPSYDAITRALANGEPIHCLWHPNGGRDGFALTYQGITVINGDGLVNSQEYFEQVRAKKLIAAYLRANNCPYFISAYDDPTASGVVHKAEEAILIQRSFGANALWKLVSADAH